VKKPHRCLDCGKHFSMARPVTAYANTRKCPSCKSTRVRFDEYEYKRRLDRRKNTCCCDGLAFPHRPASTVFCRQHPVGPSEEDYRYQYESGYSVGRY
jgi:hypothetical protein